MFARARLLPVAGLSTSFESRARDNVWNAGRLVDRLGLGVRYKLCHLLAM
jgi:hypothetical protein